MRRSSIALYVVAAVSVAMMCVSRHVDTLALGSCVTGRLFYTFVHAGWIHLAANIMAINAVARSRFKVSITDIAFAYIIAAAAPSMETPVVGASVFVYALFGIISWQAKYRWRFNAFVAAFIALGFLMSPHLANTLHLYAYMSGLTLGYAWRIPVENQKHK